ncbi:hypothetical protein NL676_003853 [Syzygium grande]|nr:hypothetical protein NL676_003853 [Syzygium grande]
MIGKEPAEDYDFSDAALKYINQMLMEEDIEEKSIMCHEAFALEAAEKSFYEVIGERYPPAADQHLSPNQTNESSCGSSAGAINWVESEPNCGSRKHTVLTTLSQSFSSSIGQSLDGVYVSISTTGAVALPELIDSESVMQFNGNADEARKLLAFGNEIVVNRRGVNFPGRKNPLQEDGNLEEGRMNKHSSVYTESTVRSEMFDIVLLNRKGSEAALRESLRNVMQNGPPKELNEGKGQRQEARQAQEGCGRLENSLDALYTSHYYG